MAEVVAIEEAAEDEPSTITDESAAGSDPRMKRPLRRSRRIICEYPIFFYLQVSFRPYFSCFITYSITEYRETCKKRVNWPNNKESWMF